MLNTDGEVTKAVYKKPNFNVLRALDSRERLCRVASPYRLNLKILREIVCQKESTFKKIWEARSKHPITCEDGKLYFDRFKTCLTLCGMNSLPSTLYRLSSHLEDAIVYSGSLGYLPTKPNSHKPFFLGLTESCWLHLYDNFTGKLLEKVYLGSPKRYKYRHVDWNTHGESITVQTVRNQQQAEQSHRPRVLVTIAVFTVFPLEFEALLEIDRKVFGKDCNHVNVSEGLLIVGTGSAVSGNVRLYNFQQMIKEGTMFTAKLNQRCEQLDGQEVGHYPGGIPLNCRVKEAPPVLFEVKCSEYTLHIGGYPWHYITTPPKMDGVFEVHELSSQNFVEGGHLNIPNDSTEPDSIAFLPDDSGRIVYNSSHSIKFFKLVDGIHSGIKAMKQCFELSFIDQEQPYVNKCSAGGASHCARATRQVKRTSYSSVLRRYEKSIVSDDYENELDLYAVLGFDPDDANCSAKLLLADSQTGETLKVINLNFQVNEFSDYSLTMDLETLVIIVRNQMHQFLCLVYRLDSQAFRDEVRSVRLSKLKDEILQQRHSRKGRIAKRERR